MLATINNTGLPRALRFSAGALSLCALFALPPAHAMPSTAAELQAVLHAQIDGEREDLFSVIPMMPVPSVRQLAHTLLDKLDQQAAYRRDMQEWLDENAGQETTQEDLVRDWFRHYHDVLTGGALEFLDDQTLTLLWRSLDRNPVSALKRTDCRKAGSKPVQEALRKIIEKLTTGNRERLSSALARAYARELERRQAAANGDIPQRADKTEDYRNAIDEFNRAIPKKDLPWISRSSEGGKDSPKPSAEENCERIWVISHAVANTTIPHARTLREFSTMSMLQAMFDYNDKPYGLQSPTPSGFVPGDAMVYIPDLPGRRDLKGSTIVKVGVDDAGKLSEFAMEDVDLDPAVVTSGDGKTYNTLDLLRPVVENYFRDGSFPPRVVDGKPVPYGFKVKFVWKMD